MKGILLKYNDYTYKISVASAASIVVGLNGIRNFECHLQAGAFDPQRNSFIQWVGEFVPLDVKLSITVGNIDAVSEPIRVDERTEDRCCVADDKINDPEDWENKLRRFRHLEAILKEK